MFLSDRSSRCAGCSIEVRKVMHVSGRGSSRCAELLGRGEKPRKVMKGDVSDGGVPVARGCSIEGRRHRLWGGGGGGAISSGEDRLFLNPHQTVSIVRSRYFLHENLGFSPILYCRAAPAASCTFMYVL